MFIPQISTCDLPSAGGRVLRKRCLGPWAQEADVWSCLVCSERLPIPICSLPWVLLLVFYFFFLTPAEKSWQIVNINSYWIGFVPRLLKKQFSMSAKPYMYPKSYRKKSEQVILWLSSHPGPRAASEGGFFSGGSFFSTTLQPSAAPVKFCFVRLK